MEHQDPTSSGGAAAAPAKWVPRWKREGFTGPAPTGAVMGRDFQTAQDRMGMELEKLGFVKGASANWYYPAQHPHVHIGRGQGGWFMAFSDGQQHRGGGGTSMMRDGAKLRNYSWGVQQLLQRQRSDGASPTRDVVDAASALLAGG